MRVRRVADVKSAGCGTSCSHGLHALRMAGGGRVFCRQPPRMLLVVVPVRALYCWDRRGRDEIPVAYAAQLVAGADAGGMYTGATCPWLLWLASPAAVLLAVTRVLWWVLQPCCSSARPASWAFLVAGVWREAVPTVVGREWAVEPVER